MEKRERFKRLAPKRTNSVLDKLRILSHCADRSTYEYSEEEVNKIFAEIAKRLEETRARFRFVRKDEFKL